MTNTDKVRADLQEWWDSYASARGIDSEHIPYSVEQAYRAGREARRAESWQQHVAYFDEGEFHWLSGIAPRNCELYTAPPSTGGAVAARCEDCPPTGYPTDKTRCDPCDRRGTAPAAYQWKHYDAATGNPVWRENRVYNGSTSTERRALYDHPPKPEGN